MTDLDLGLFPQRGAGAPKPPHFRRSRKVWIRRGITLVVSLALLAGLLHLVSIGRDQIVDNFSSTRDYKTTGTGTQILVVTSRMTTKQVGAAAAKAKIVRSSGAFDKAFAEQRAITKVAPGYYRLRQKMSAASAVALLADPSSKYKSKVTIPEGTSLSNVLTRVANGTTMARADLRKAAAHPVLIDLPAWAHPTNLEGFLYPLTYQFDPRSNAIAAMQQMVAAFNDEAFYLDLQDSVDKVHHTPYDVLKIASIIEKEAGVTADYPKVARVIYNRLAIHKELQLDSTLNYVLPQRKGHLSTADLQNPSAFNTYNHKGLPPTPIDSPGAKALRAALNPADGNWIYFVTIDKLGHAFFTNSYKDFLSAKKTAKHNGVIN